MKFRAELETTSIGNLLELWIEFGALEARLPPAAGWAEVVREATKGNEFGFESGLAAISGFRLTRTASRSFE